MLRVRNDLATNGAPPRLFAMSAAYLLCSETCDAAGTFIRDGERLGGTPLRHGTTRWNGVLPCAKAQQIMLILRLCREIFAY